jgi:hypothetical protein
MVQRREQRAAKEAAREAAREAESKDKARFERSQRLVLTHPRSPIGAEPAPEHITYEDDATFIIAFE